MSNTHPERTRRLTIEALRKAAVVLIVAGLAGVVLFGGMAYLAAIWGFVTMDNPPPDPLWVPMWNIGRVGFMVAAATVACGLILSLPVIVAAVRHRRS